jgi:subtilisin family serine protease
MCKDMPFYTYGNNSGLDYNGHGTNVVGLIGENINSSKYCITMYAFSKNSTLKELNDMLHDMRNHNLAGLNMSLASIGYDKREEIELKGLANANVKIFIASGNEKIDLDKGCNVYPACHKLTVKNIVVVGSTDKRYSNHGKIVDIYIDGTKKGFPVKTGTSMSTAIATGLHFSK